MSPRAGGFVAMFATALLLLATLAPIPVGGQTNAWWSGHPSVDGGKPIEAKEVNISLFTSKGCNTGGDGGCQPVPLGGGFRAVRYTELGLVLLLALATLLLGITSLRGRSSRAGLAKLVMVSAMIGAIGSIVLLVMGPDVKSSKAVAIPMGPGLILFFIGTALSIGAAVIALLPHRPARPRIQLPSQMPVPQPSAGFDVQALLAEDALRPSSLGPEPMMGRPQSPGGALPGPAGPLVPPSGPQPLFQAAPQLRPLYEVNGGGFTPPASQSVQFPSRGPTPMPHAAVSAALGLDTPASGLPMAPPIPASGPAPVIPLPPLPAPPPAPPIAPKLPPPTRTKAMSAAPPIPSLASRPPPPATRPPPPATRPPPPTTKPPPLKPPSSSPTMMSAAVPPPPPSRPSADDLLKTADFEKSLATGDRTDNIDANLPFDSTAEASAPGFDENTDVGGNAVDDVETAAREKVDAADAHAPAPEARGSMTQVELEQRTSGTALDVAAAPGDSTSSVISSAAPPAKLPISTAPESLPPPPEAQAAGGPSPACPQCEAPMRWVEEHLRFFCKSCRMYF